MTFNLLLWKWSDDYNTPAKRKKLGNKVATVTSEFARVADHPAIGPADILELTQALNSEFGAEENLRPFVLECHPKCAVVNYPNAARFDLVPKVAAVGKRFGFNAAEF